MTTIVGNPHDAKLERSWQRCRDGLGLYLESSPQGRQQTRDWIEFQGRNTGVRYYEEWLELLSDPHRGCRDLLEVGNYKDLPRDRQEFWRPLIQTLPFVSLLRPLA